MEKKRISFVFNPHNMREKTEQDEPYKVYKRYDRNIARTLICANSSTTKYVHSKKAKVLHDRDCTYVRMISSKNARITERFDWGGELRHCKVCYRKAVLRNGFKDNQNYDAYMMFFNKHKVSTELLYELFVECGAKASIKGDYVEIHCNEDTWRILLKSKEGEVELRHNNYVRNFLGERYFVNGYHKQSIQDKTLAGVLKYIMSYDYHKFHNPEKTLTQNITNIFAEEFEKAFAERSTGYGNK